jgi:hypothetical protein
VSLVTQTITVLFRVDMYLLQLQSHTHREVRGFRPTKVWFLCQYPTYVYSNLKARTSFRIRRFCLLM